MRFLFLALLTTFSLSACAPSVGTAASFGVVLGGASASSEHITSRSAFGRYAPLDYVAMWDGYVAEDDSYSGRDLTRITLEELSYLNDDFYAQTPRDIRFWCPAFRRQSLEGRKAFYLALISGIARYETDFRAHVKYLETGGHYSRGLLQLGQQSLSYYPGGSRCDVSGDPRQLHDLQENISCGVMLLDHWIRRDGYIASGGNGGKGDARYFGAARYWSTLRHDRRGRDEIASYTRSIDVCR